MSNFEPHLLIVDDDERIRQLLLTFLKRNGFLVTGARDAGSVEVLIRGRSILISRSAFQRTERMGGRRAYGIATRASRSATRLRLPRDADMRRLKREERDGVITITVPPLQPVRPAPGVFGYYPYR